MVSEMEMIGKAAGVDGLEEIESRAVELVREAGAMALQWLRRPLEVEFKHEGRSDPVTQADREIEAFLRSSISREFPGHAILGEEGTEVEAAGDFLWVLDPLDGTTNFMNGLPLFSCSAGLLHRGQPVVGAIFVPAAPPARGGDPTPGASRGAGVPRPAGVSGVLHARVGGGAFLDGDPVRVSSAPMPEPTSLVGLPGHHARQFARFDRLRGSPGEPRCLGSVCLEIAMVACGVFQYAVFRAPRLWDVAAGNLIVQEAGGLSLGWQRGRWAPIAGFQPMRNPTGNREMGLRFWSMVTLVGGDPVARFVAERLRPRSGLGTRAVRLISRLLGA